MPYTLKSLEENLTRHYKDYKIKVDLNDPSSFETFVDRETHGLLSDVGLFSWNAEKEMFEGLSADTYAHCRYQVSRVVARVLDEEYKISKTKRLSDYLLERGLLNKPA